MAAAAIALHLRAKNRVIPNPRLSRLLSSSASDSNAEPQNDAASSPPSPSQSQSNSSSSSSSSSSSYFSDVKARLRQQSQQPRQPSSLSSGPPPSQGTSNVASLGEIRKNLSEFRRRTAVTPPPGDNSSSPAPLVQTISFQELYKRNVISKGEESSSEAGKGGRLSFDAIRESLRQLRGNIQKNQGGETWKGSDPMSLSKFKDSFKLKPADPSPRDPAAVFGGLDTLPSSVFGKEMKAQREVESLTMKTEFVKMYTYGELGDKLKKLRPETKAENWFSLKELNERLVKLREMEEKETESRIGGITFKDLRESLKKLQMSDDQKTKRQTVQRLDILGQLDGTPNFMLKPPREHLVEKYFHPDNMSSSEKLKLELRKVRDEFKMSKSDCGSARVQVAQLTTKIKHLSTALHKKDKHSRKGLHEMVEKRKKLLRYLRRTDWNSYCLVLSKLGLRDNPQQRR